VRAFCTPKRSRVSTREAELFAHARREPFDVDLSQLSELGRVPGLPEAERKQPASLMAHVFDGRPDRARVLLLHGWDGQASRWSHLVTALRDAGHAVAVFDAPAHGEAPGELLTLPLYVHCLQRALSVLGAFDVMVGHSFGAMAAMRLLQIEPASTGKLAVLGMAHQLKRLAENAARGAGWGGQTYAAFQRQFEAWFGVGRLDLDFTHIAAQLQVPGIVVQDEADVFASYEGAQALAAAWPRGRFIPISGSGHYAMIRNAQVIEAVGALCK
jgi:pimeloyl-ACP methyl ester carboxylesterase